jgi:sugar/nucleoside kinase (ribokinase family)
MSEAEASTSGDDVTPAGRNPDRASDRPPDRAPNRTLGVIGTLVWDTIHQRDVRSGPVSEWGGIGYALEALGAALPPGWTVRPILKIGRDLSEEAFRFLNGISGVDPGAVRVVPEPNNRVELRYAGQERQAERLSGGVPAWKEEELLPLVAGCDALYVNFISGMEMDLQAAQALRRGFDGPIYADLHSLFLAIGPQGDRIPRALPYWAEWLRSFDAVQLNEQEFELLGRAYGDPWRLAADVVGSGLGLIAVTLGPRGAAYVVGGGFVPDPFAWRQGRGRLASPGPSRSAKVDAEQVTLEGGDPTGCGDVWGATCFGRLFAGATLEEAMADANRFAARNVTHRGASGLGLHLLGRLERGSVPWPATGV